ncbi:tRNA (guanosine(46)-N7)-methyltransferase TrmB [Spongisporangium articulatum]|uniref:tRNA (guanine-N(7)-)-methyltransferase n=1 Tax=Spongisporangium articulatum TaxID=3362603 RepID=A0ABW8ATE3_9ACTN
MSDCVEPRAGAVRTYKLRRSRIGQTRRAALDTLLHRYALPEGELSLAGLFGDGVPVVLEIGFGVGTSTLAMADAEPELGVIAAEVHTPGVATLVQGLDEGGLTNVRVLVGDGRELLEERIPSGSLAGVRVFFPDPWPKARHHKRRLVEPAFVALVADRLAPGGLLHCATDWADYAQQMVEALDAEPRLTLSAERGRPAWRPVTRFEARAHQLGRPVVDLLAARS